MQRKANSIKVWPNSYSLNTIPKIKVHSQVNYYLSNSKDIPTNVTII